jgi:hypothetical protein
MSRRAALAAACIGVFVGSFGGSYLSSKLVPEPSAEDPFTVLCHSLAIGDGVGVVRTNATDRVMEVPRNWDIEPLRVMGEGFKERYCQIDFGPGIAPGPVVAWAER